MRTITGCLHIFHEKEKRGSKTKTDGPQHTHDGTEMQTSEVEEGSVHFSLKDRRWRNIQLTGWTSGLQVRPLVRHHAVHLVDGGGEGAQAYLLRLVDDLRSRLLPLFRHLQIFVCIDKEVEGT